MAATSITDIAAATTTNLFEQDFIGVYLPTNSFSAPARVSM
jgi:hypothetical protein